MIIFTTGVTIIYLLIIFGSKASGFFIFSNNWDETLIDEDVAKVFFLSHCLN